MLRPASKLSPEEGTVNEITVNGRPVEQKWTASDDGVQIAYETLGHGDQTILLANGLGGRLHAWEPLIERFWKKNRIVTWDYRGLFGSESPPISRLHIPEHAEDARAVLDAEKIESAVVVSWSMGVQVALEMASLYPKRIDGLVLINGTHGHAMSTGFQPLFRVPFLPRLLHEIIDGLRRRPAIIDGLSRLARSKLNTGLLGGLLSWYYDNEDIERAYRQYIEDIFGTSFGNYLRLFQELDAHSVYHHLGEIHHPTLVVSGLLDPLTPAYQSFEIARRLPNAEHVHIWGGTHFVLLEYPDRVLSAIENFLESHR